MLYIAFLLALPLLVAGDHCSGASVCPAIAASVEAILVSRSFILGPILLLLLHCSPFQDVRKMLGCCSHDACMPSNDFVSHLVTELLKEVKVLFMVCLRCWVSHVLSEVDHELAALHAERLCRQQGSLHEPGEVS